VIRQCLHRMAFFVFVLCWAGSTFLSKKSLFGQGSLFVFLMTISDYNFPGILHTSLLQSLCFFNLTKISLHRELFLRVSWRRSGSGGKVGGNWVGRGKGVGLMEVKDMVRIPD
jgi:hypothetical protein